MGIISTEGFDLYATKTGTEFGLASRWTIGGNTTGTFSAGHYGQGQCMRYSNPTSTAVKDQLNFGAAYAAQGQSMTVLVSEVATDWGIAGTGEPIYALYDSANGIQLEVMLDPAGNFHFRRGATVIASTSGGPFITANVVAQLEHEVVINDSTGSIKFWVDGVQRINVSALDTQNTANANVQYFTMAPSNTLDSVLEIDNLIFTDGARPGANRRVITLRPNADTADKDFVASTGVDNFAMVDDTTLSNADYVQGSIVGDLDLYDLTDLPVGIGIVDAVSFLMYAAKTDVAARTARAVLKSNATSSNTSALTLATTYAPVRKVELVNPNGGGAWSVAAVNALKVGVEVVS